MGDVPDEPGLLALPELPDIAAWLAALEPRVVGSVLARVRVTSPFLLRSADPPLSAVEGRSVVGLRRLGKRIVFSLSEDLSLVLHLMIAGRLRWKSAVGAAVPGKVGLAAFDFSTGTLLLTEAGTKKRASLYVVRGDVSAHDPGGLEVLEASLPEFEAVLRRENRTLKRALTDPRLFSGIGNAYSDEILWRARMSPVRLTSQMSFEEVSRLYLAVRESLGEWVSRLVGEALVKFPEHVTAFRPEMAVHGRYRQPCPACGAPVQRIAYADNETNYCPGCQTGGKLLADRSLSRLLKKDWPRTLEELERLKDR